MRILAICILVWIICAPMRAADAPGVAPNQRAADARPAVAGSSGLGPLTNRPALEITAGFGVAMLRSNMVFYSNNVVVVDPPAKPGDSNTVLRCQELTARRGTNGSFERIIAHGSVIIEQGEMRAAGDHAEYDALTEQIRLTGESPMIFSSQFTNRARVIVYNRRTGDISFEGVRTEIPGATLGNAGTRTNATPGASTNKPGSPRNTRLF